MMIKCCIFDLDGVIVDTAKYHFLAWKALADKLGIQFTETDNEKLKGVSRVASLNIILELGKLALSPEAFEQALVEKNNRYLGYIKQLQRSEILPGVSELLADIRRRGIEVALGSASKNARLILERLDLLAVFDVVVDGNQVSKAKPDPEVFLQAARQLDIDPAACLVFEDAEAGVEAALNAGMRVVGVGSPEILGRATLVLPDLADTTLDNIVTRL